jgi:transposase-like protein
MRKDVEYCPACGSSYFEYHQGNYLYKCECGAVFSVDFYEGD